MYYYIKSTCKHVSYRQEVEASILLKSKFGGLKGHSKFCEIDKAPTDKCQRQKALTTYCIKCFKYLSEFILAHHIRAVKLIKRGMKTKKALCSIDQISPTCHIHC